MKFLPSTFGIRYFTPWRDSIFAFLEFPLSIKLAAFQASGDARMKLHMAGQRTAEPQNNEPQNFEGWYRCALSFWLKSIEFLTSTFDIRYSLFDIRFFRVSYTINLAASAARGWAETSSLAPAEFWSPARISRDRP
jgi:hypothetical protein